MLSRELKLPRWGIGTIVVLAVLIAADSHALAQEAPTPTPLVIALPTSTPIPDTGVENLQVATATWTPTDTAPVILEALDIANVRALPDTAEAQLGVIRAGEFYPVTGRYVNWYQLRYEAARGGVGWVYGELVRITGDPNSIPEVNPYAEPNAPAAEEDSAGVGASGTDGSGSQGGVIATATALSGGIGGDGSIALTPIPQMPTFTYPPGLVRPQSTSTATGEEELRTQTTSTTTSDFPPIAPILILGGLGLLGLAVTSIRR